MWLIVSPDFRMVNYGNLKNGEPHLYQSWVLDYKKTLGIVKYDDYYLISELKFLKTLPNVTSCPTLVSLFEFTIALYTATYNTYT